MTLACLPPTFAATVLARRVEIGRGARLLCHTIAARYHYAAQNFVSATTPSPVTLTTRKFDGHFTWSAPLQHLSCTKRQSDKASSE
jgi:hypothetical protein